MLKKNWCLIVLVIVIVVGGVLFYRWYRYYNYSPIEGHTAAAASGSRSSDDYDHCFAQNDANDVILVANLPGTRADDVKAVLVDLNMMGMVDPTTKPPAPVPGTQVVGQVLPESPEIMQSNGKVQIRFTEHRFHLGPGPYMVVASMPGMSFDKKAGAAPKKLFYYYQTYPKDKNLGPDQCVVYHEPKYPPQLSLFINGYTGYKDLEHCFVQDDPNHPERDKPLYFEAYTDVKIDSKDKIQLTLTDVKNGPVQMTRGSQWDVVDLQDHWFKIQINADAPPHLGPGPYTATVSATTLAAKGQASVERQWFYPYATWKESSSPADCLYWH